jgi:putative flippase GtrA
MHDEVTVVDVSRAPAGRQTSIEIDPARPHLRILHGMRQPANWLQLVRFGLVGGTGFVINVGVYALCVHPLAMNYRIAFVVAWMVAVTNNFLLNRYWTFDAAAGSVRFQAVRFVAVSAAAAVFGFMLLTVFVEGFGLAKVPAEALAVAASTPLNFLGNKLWSFRHHGRAVARP